MPSALGSDRCGRYVRGLLQLAEGEVGAPEEALLRAEAATVGEARGTGRQEHGTTWSADLPAEHRACPGPSPLAPTPVRSESQHRR